MMTTIGVDAHKGNTGHCSRRSRARVKPTHQLGRSAVLEGKAAGPFAKERQEIHDDDTKPRVSDDPAFTIEVQ
jgi:hypothetical protein